MAKAKKTKSKKRRPRKKGSALPRTRASAMARSSARIAHRRLAVAYATITNLQDRIIELESQL